MQLATSVIGAGEAYRIIATSFFSPRSAQVAILVNPAAKEMEASISQEDTTKELPKKDQMLADFFETVRDVLSNDLGYLIALADITKETSPDESENSEQLGPLDPGQQKAVRSLLLNVYLGICPTKNDHLKSVVLTLVRHLNLVGDDFHDRDLTFSQTASTFALKKPPLEVYSENKVTLDRSILWKNLSLQNEVEEGWKKKLPKEVSDDVLSCVPAYTSLPHSISITILDSGLLQNLEKFSSEMLGEDKDHHWVPAFLRCLLTHFRDLDGIFHSSGRQLLKEGSRLSSLLTTDLEILSQKLPLKVRDNFSRHLDGLREKYLPHLKRLAFQSHADEIAQLEAEHQTRIAALFEQKKGRAMAKMKRLQESFRFVPKKQAIQATVVGDTSAEADVCVVTREPLDGQASHLLLVNFHLSNVGSPQ